MQSETRKRWYENNKDRVREQLNRWKANNPEKIKSYHKKYYELHKDKIIIKVKNYRARRNQMDKMTSKQKSQIIEILDHRLMEGVQRKRYKSITDINETQEINRAFEEVMQRKPTENEEDAIYYSDEFTNIIEEIEEYFYSRERARESRGHFEDFTHDNPHGWRGGARSDKNNL